MTDLAENLRAVRTRIDAAARAAGRDPASVALLAISKTRPASDVHALAALGQVGVEADEAVKPRDVPRRALAGEAMAALAAQGVVGARSLEPLDRLARRVVRTACRTGGEQRLSNFLIWQAAYAELYTTEVLWPDFGADAFDAALLEFASRTRRFGR